MENIIEQKANQIAADMEKNGVQYEIVVDIMLVLTIISIIVGLIQVYQNCKKTPAQAHQSMIKPGVLEKWRLRKIAKAKIDDPEMYDHINIKLINSIINVGKTLTIEDVQKMYQEADQRQ